MRHTAALIGALALLTAEALPAGAQLYRFPGGAQYDEFYPTSYYDHSGQDWNCGGNRYDGHRGSDYGGGSFTGMDEGRDIVAAADGQVTQIHDGEFDRCTTGDCPGGSGYGNHVRIMHADGKLTIYAHLKQWSVAVAVDDWVQCGDFLGEMGSSGYSTGPHLHFEVRNTSNTAVDPFHGNCSSGPSLWVDQGVYDEKPLPLCPGPLPECVPVDLITCGASFHTSNDAAGSTDEHVFYGCSDFVYTGPELVWRMITDQNEPVTVSVTGVSADLDLYVLDSLACNGTGCIEASSEPNESDESLTFDAVAGTEYYILVDGWEGAVSEFDFAVDCQGGLPVGPDAGPTGPDAGPLADGAAASDAVASGSDAADASSSDNGDGLNSGCGCRARGSADGQDPLVLLLLLLTLLGWVRHGRRIHR